MRLSEDGTARPEERPAPTEPVLRPFGVRLAIAATSAALVFIIPALTMSAASPRSGVGAFGPARFWDRDAFLEWSWLGIIPGTLVGCAAWASISSCGRRGLLHCLAIVAVGSIPGWIGLALLFGPIEGLLRPGQGEGAAMPISLFCVTTARIAGPSIFIAECLAQWSRPRGAG